MSAIHRTGDFRRNLPMQEDLLPVSAGTKPARAVMAKQAKELAISV